MDGRSLVRQHRVWPSACRRNVSKRVRVLRESKLLNNTFLMNLPLPPLASCQKEIAARPGD